MSSGFRAGSGTKEPLDTQEMAEGAEVFIESYQHVLSNYGSDSRTEIQRFVVSVVLTEKAFMLVTPEGLDRAISLVFQQKHVRDFILTLQYVFAARWGMSQEKMERLAANLAYGAAPMLNVPTPAMPNAVADRLVSFEEAYTLLVSNHWLVILMLLLLFLSVEQPKA